MGVGEGSGKGGNFLWSIFWFLVLILVGFWVAGFCAGWYILVSIFVPCIPDLNSIADFLLRGVNFARTCSENMVARKSLS